jgi:periplasmic protein TonB
LQAQKNNGAILRHFILGETLMAGYRVIGAMDHKQKTNWLLYILIAVSLAIHVGIFFFSSGRFNFKKPSYIEISVRKNSRPEARHIPRPRVRPKAPVPQKSFPNDVYSDYTVPVPKSVSEIPSDQYLQEIDSIHSVVEDIPRDIKPDIYEMSLPEIVETSGFGSRMDYLDMVRFKIERYKAYPVSARQHNIEGLVVVAFVIGSDGDVSGLKVTNGSGYPALDNAAILAVKKASPFLSPPGKFFGGPVRVKVPITFELIR